MLIRWLLIFGLITITLSARKSIVIDLTKQEAYAYENGKLVISGWISTGKYGHRTPRGRFRILEKDLRHVSSKYPEPMGGARMDYMMRLTNSGIAMHLGFVPNYPASHGCIRLTNGFAQKVYFWAPVGTPVLIKGYTPVRVSRNFDRKSLFSSTNTKSRSNRSSRNSSSFYSKSNNISNDITNYNCVVNDPISILSSVPGKAKCKSYRNTLSSRSKKRKTFVAKESRRRVLKTRRLKPIKKFNDPLSILRG